MFCNEQTGVSTDGKMLNMRTLPWKTSDDTAAARVDNRKYGGHFARLAAIADKRHGLAAESYFVIHNSFVFE